MLNLFKTLFQKIKKVSKLQEIAIATGEAIVFIPNRRPHHILNKQKKIKANYIENKDAKKNQKKK